MTSTFSRSPVAALVLATALASACAVHAQDAPKRKPGLWQQTMTTSGAAIPPQSMSMCTDEKTDQLVTARAGDNQRCTQQSARRQGNNVVIDAVCNDGKTTIRTHGVFSGDFNTRYSGELRSTFEPPMHGMKEMTQKIDARWVGPCKPGQKPGDVALEGMGGMNMNELMGADPKKMQEMMQQMQQMQKMQQQPR
ncbi:MAG: DUF3617 family protein [Burkholderiales bacterium]|nr:DUF3617 family protein [Burkholderiales bacterium]